MIKNKTKELLTSKKVLEAFLKILHKIFFFDNSYNLYKIWPL